MKVLLTIGCLLLGATAAPAFVIDHTTTDLTLIPEAWIDSAKANLHIGYEHTSHGTQIPTGMAAVESYLGGPFTYNDGPASGDLDLDDDGMASYYSGANDLGYCPEWVHATRNYLAANTDVNVIMWSWCALHANEVEIDEYLDSMSTLEAEFPGVRFVYMTGHSNGGGEDGTFHIWNRYIRTFCEENDKVLFDFYDLECYDPDGNYYGDLNITDDLSYTGGNWGTEWLAANPGTQLDSLTGACGYCSHSDNARLNCVLKGKAAWWMWARLAGWEGTTVSVAMPQDGRTVKGSGILRAEPSPFTRITTLHCTPATGTVDICRHDGCLVRTVGVTGHRVVWDGCDMAGAPVPAGLYYAVMTTAAGAPVSIIVKTE